LFSSHHKEKTGDRGGHKGEKKKYKGETPNGRCQTGRRAKNGIMFVGSQRESGEPTPKGALTEQNENGGTRAKQLIKPQRKKGPARFYETQSIPGGGAGGELFAATGVRKGEKKPPGGGIRANRRSRPDPSWRRQPKKKGGQPAQGRGCVAKTSDKSAKQTGNERKKRGGKERYGRGVGCQKVGSTLILLAEGADPGLRRFSNHFEGNPAARKAHTAEGLENTPRTSPSI